MRKKLKFIDNKDRKTVIDGTKGDIKSISVLINKLKSFRDTFSGSLGDVLIEQQKIKNAKSNESNTYYDKFKQTHNSEIIINPEFTTTEGKLSIKADIGMFQSYHAYNGLKNGFGDDQIDFGNEVRYSVVSAGVVMYNPDTKSFYVFKRPDTSQEASGEIDILGGYLNTKEGAKDGKIAPEEYIASKVKTKFDIDINTEKLKFMGVQEFKKRGFHNIVYFYPLNDNETDILKKQETILEIKANEYDTYKTENNPGGAGLTLAGNFLKT